MGEGMGMGGMGRRGEGISRERNSHAGGLAEIIHRSRSVHSRGYSFLWGGSFGVWERMGVGWERRWRRSKQATEASKQHEQTYIEAEKEV